MRAAHSWNRPMSYGSPGPRAMTDSRSARPSAMTAAARIPRSDGLRGLRCDRGEVRHELVELRRHVLLQAAGVGETGDLGVDRDPRHQWRVRGDDELQSL